MTVKLWERILRTLAAILCGSLDVLLEDLGLLAFLDEPVLHCFFRASMVSSSYKTSNDSWIPNLKKEKEKSALLFYYAYTRSINLTGQIN